MRLSPMNFVVFVAVAATYLYQSAQEPRRVEALLKIRADEAAQVQAQKSKEKKDERGTSQQISNKH